MKLLILFTFMLIGAVASADEVDMRDYIKLQKGMSEAEVLYLLGPYDHETIRSDRFDYIFSRTWYYIPYSRGSGKWITEIRFNDDGRIIAVDRYRARD